MSALDIDLESFLYCSGQWVSARELCSRFGVRKRQLRALDGEPGLCTRIAISGDKGYKHILLATTDEWERHKRRETRIHGGALASLRHKEERRHEALTHTKRTHMTFERDSGQAVMTLTERSGDEEVGHSDQ